MAAITRLWWRTLPRLVRDAYESFVCCVPRFWSVESQFQDMTLWSHDSVPARDHPLYGLGEWLEVARAVSERDKMSVIMRLMSEIG